MTASLHTLRSAAGTSFTKAVCICRVEMRPVVQQHWNAKTGAGFEA